MNDFQNLDRDIIACEKCPRLREWCQKVALEKRKSFADQAYWGKPVPNFGDPRPKGLVVGLAPAAHGANRTGRMFTGDRSGDWLYRALHKAGLANQPEAIDQNDGLTLNKIVLTATCHCAPPDNKPTIEEIANCRPFLERTLALQDYRAYLCLGQIGWKELFRCLGVKPIPKFGHGVEYLLESGVNVLASYHPSQQNTFTGRLTEPMLDQVVQRFADLLA